MDSGSSISKRKLEQTEPDDTDAFQPEVKIRKTDHDVDDGVPANCNKDVDVEGWLDWLNYLDVMKADEDNYPSSTGKGKGKGKARTKTSAITRTSTTRVRRKGRLAFMMNLPQDIFCDIAGFLSPLDLLHLARASKTLRELLMSRNSKPIWRAARFGLPSPLEDGPPDLSEPNYASLVFERYCHGCNAPHSKTLFFALRRRFCRNCTTNKLIRASKRICFEDGNVEVPLVAFSLIPATDGNGMSVESQTMNTDIDPILSAKNRYLVDHVKTIVQHYFAVSCDTKAWTEFVDKKRTEVVNILDHARKVDEWKNQREIDRTSELYRARNERRETIFEKLKALGYEDVLHCSYYDNDRGKKWHKAVYNSRKITDRTWERILPELRLILDKRKEEKELRQRLTSAVVPNLPNTGLPLEGPEFMGGMGSNLAFDEFLTMLGNDGGGLDFRDFNAWFNDPDMSNLDL